MWRTSSEQMESIAAALEGVHDVPPPDSPASSTGGVRSGSEGTGSFSASGLANPVTPRRTGDDLHLDGPSTIEATEMMAGIAALSVHPTPPPP